MKPTMEQNAMMMEEDHRRRLEEVRSRFPTAEVPYHLNVFEIDNLELQLSQKKARRENQEFWDSINRESEHRRKREWDRLIEKLGTK